MSKRRSFEEVKAVFDRAGYQLLSTFYKSAHDFLIYRCPEGHEHQVRFYSFRRLGSRCPSCHGTLRLTLDVVRQKFAEAGHKLLEDQYVNSSTPMRFRCSCGNVSRMRWGEFQQGRKGCADCGFASCRGENHPRWVKDRERFALLKKISDKSHSALKTTLKTLGRRKNGKTRELLGYTHSDLLAHLQKHPAWDEIKDKRWSLDHIFPIKAFADHNVLDVTLINCLENLQPMLLRDNCSKNDNYDEKEFVEWLARRQHGSV